MNKNTFLKSISLLESAFDKKLSKGSINIYWSRMKDYKDGKFKEAVVRCVDELNYFPKIAELKGILDGKPADEAEKAWIMLKEKIEKSGGYNSVSFPGNPIIGKVVEDYMGGWIKICDMKIEEEKWIRKDFVKYYQIIKNDGGNIIPEKLPGIFEIENNQKGYSEEYMIERYGRYLDGTKVKGKKLLKEKIK